MLVCGLKGQSQGIRGINRSDAVNTSLDCVTADNEAVTGLVTVPLGRDVDNEVDLDRKCVV